jgi:hypothetical protein
MKIQGRMRMNNFVLLKNKKIIQKKILKDFQLDQLKVLKKTN